MGDSTWTLKLEVRFSVDDMADAIGGNEMVESNL
jgi:hypothetical protein